jgi:cytochrome c oxidase cbb3-type subunit III
MSDQNRLLDHNYDGIQEYDNPMPRWWVWVFWATIVFSQVYFVYYHLLDGNPTMHDEFAYEVEHWNARMIELAPPEVTTADLEAVLADPARLELGAALFVAKCASCHLLDGGGLVGPNLCDDYWIHGSGGLKEIRKVIHDGVPAKGMLSWGPLLKPDEINDVTAYVASLVGTTPASPKAPEGTQLTQ